MMMIMIIIIIIIICYIRLSSRKHEIYLSRSATIFDKQALCPLEQELYTCSTFRTAVSGKSFSKLSPKKNTNAHPIAYYKP